MLLSHTLQPKPDKKKVTDKLQNIETRKMFNETKRKLVYEIIVQVFITSKLGEFGYRVYSFN